MRTFFPLRSNSKGLVAGKGVSAFKDRVKIASLISDEVVLQGGEYSVAAGPTALVQLWDPARSTDKWQTARERAHDTGRTYPIQVGEGDGMWEAARLHPEFFWVACFDPLKRELPKGCDWIGFDTVDLTTEGSKIADDYGKQTIAKLPAGTQGSSTYLLRDTLAGHVCRDLIAADALQSTMMMDRGHHAQLQHVLRDAERREVFGQHAVQFAVPAPAKLSWEDIAELREQRGWKELRRVWSEVDAVAWDRRLPLNAIPVEVAREYGERLRRAAEDSSPNWAERLIYPHVGMTIGTLLGFIATAHGVGGFGSTAIGAYAGMTVDLATGAARDRVSQPRWVAAHYDLQARRRT